MASIVALVPDLLFGSKVKAMLEADGHAVSLVSSADAAREAAAAADVIVADLAGGDVDAGSLLAGAPPGLRTLACYSHVDAESRRAAEEAGFQVVVPRSRMAREGAALVARLAADTG
jgi:hypothetical protein